ncbi:MAG: energy transducer TonB [Candidatus Rokubacteria bacterium]|nr:energy transducer TonB [Candidatus Rokubacteria bacterium]
MTTALRLAAPVMLVVGLVGGWPARAQETSATPKAGANDAEVFSLDPVVVTAPWPITPPTLKAVVKPEYPEEARHRGWEGTVVLLLQVGANGTVGEVRVRRASGKPILDEAAVAAARNWTFIPARQGPKTIAVWLEVPVKFELK